MQLGDVVELKSGGPNMTIEGKTDSGWLCVWFDGSDRKAFSFGEHVLKKVD